LPSDKYSRSLDDRIGDQVPDHQIYSYQAKVGIYVDLQDDGPDRSHRYDKNAKTQRMPKRPDDRTSISLDDIDPALVYPKGVAVDGISEIKYSNRKRPSNRWRIHSKSSLVE
jgi:hypothetical protein